MKYKCCECGHIFTEDDAYIYSECVGEFWGSPAYEEFMACPACKSDCIEDYEEEEEENV